MKAILRHTLRALVALALLIMASACAANDTRARIVATHPHDPGAFTQGLAVDAGVLYESTGRYGESTLRRVAPASGKILASVALDDRYFGEGLALVGKRLYQLTWKAGRVFVYDRDSLKRVAQYRYAGEGWGLTWDGMHLIMSDGSATLRVIDPEDFTVVDRLRVTENGRPVDDLNELEYIDGEIWANVWYADRIVRIDPATGRVLAGLDASGLRRRLPDDSDADVLNGIAWDATAGRLYVTGKYWPRLFEIEKPDTKKARP